jgi:hypothetical protein
MAYTTIKKPSDYFNTKLYTGNGTDATGITGVGFQPDLTWIKERSSTSPHKLLDAVRGATKELESNTQNAEATTPTSLQSFDSDGFTVGTNGAVNENTQTYASWNWLGSNTTASNTDGSITSTVSANTTSGFSIGTFSGNATTGATVGHGLGVAPSMFIVKKTNNLGDWYCYHSGIGATASIKLNEGGASATNTLWNNTALFSMDSNSAVNGSGDSYVFYAFAEKQGFSKFGSYTGNGSTDGTFIYTGFKPAFVLLKNTTGDHWTLLDNKRNTYNPESTRILANLNFTESSSETLDFLSNGFKCRRIDGAENGSGIKYIYMAFAEEPLVGDNPATAR